jgi:hypothetical protein
MNQNWISNGGTQTNFNINYPIGNYLDSNNQKEFKKVFGKSSGTTEETSQNPFR